MQVPEQALRPPRIITFRVSLNTTNSQILMPIAPYLWSVSLLKSQAQRVIEPSGTVLFRQSHLLAARCFCR